MTLKELEKRVKALEAELRLLKAEMLKLQGRKVIPGFGPVGTFADDPTFAEFQQILKENREEDYRRTMEELDREEHAAEPAKPVSRKRKPRKTNARP